MTLLHERKGVCFNVLDIPLFYLASSLLRDVGEFHDCKMNNSPHGRSGYCSGAPMCLQCKVILHNSPSLVNNSCWCLQVLGAEYFISGPFSSLSHYWTFFQIRFNIKQASCQNSLQINVDLQEETTWFLFVLYLVTDGFHFLEHSMRTRVFVDLSFPLMLWTPHHASVKVCFRHTGNVLKHTRECQGCTNKKEFPVFQFYIFKVWWWNKCWWRILYYVY